jgi:hypothetical protein
MVERVDGCFARGLGDLAQKGGMKRR